MYRICFAIANISRTGGEERMCALLANELSRRGNQVMIVSQNNYYWQPSFFEIDKRVKKYSMKRTIFEWCVCRIFPKLRYNIWKYKQLLKINKIDIIIDVDSEMSLDSVLAKRSLNIKHISWEHFSYQRYISRDISKKITPCILSEVDKLVVLTKKDRSLFITDSGIPENKIIQIYNPSPIEESQRISHEENVVLAMGRFEYEKGYDLLLQAWAIVEEKVSDWRLELVGDGSCKVSLMELSSSLGLKNVIFSPYTKQPYLKYKHSSIYVLPSRHEGLSLALLEAANMSLPIVAYDCPNGPSEIVVNDVNGYLVEQKSVASLAEHLVLLMTDKDRRERLGSCSLMTMAPFKKELIVEQWENLIGSLLDG